MQLFSLRIIYSLIFYAAFLVFFIKCAPSSAPVFESKIERVSCDEIELNTSSSSKVIVDAGVKLFQGETNSKQSIAQQLCLEDARFLQKTFDPVSGEKMRSEIFGVYPVKSSDSAHLKKINSKEGVFRVEMYNYTINLTTIGWVNIKTEQVIDVQHYQQSQPDIPNYLKEKAIELARTSNIVQKALGYEPSEETALMAGTKTALNKTKCERSRHLCVAPTFIKDDRALWAIVDLTDLRVIGIRWTEVGYSLDDGVVSERSLQDQKITSCFCDDTSSFQKMGWSLNYQLTSSDGLEVSEVKFKDEPILTSAKLVDWHVSYSGTDGFGYSDAVGCPYFSHAAVIAWEPPSITELKDESGRSSGFSLEQTFRSERWPMPCNYQYRQRFEFYKDGRFRVSAASLGRGCGDSGTYRPVFRIAFAGNSHDFSEWNEMEWKQWEYEQWKLQNDLTAYSDEGFQYKIDLEKGSFGIEPGRGQFKDGGRGDNAFTYITLSKEDIDEGSTDLITIGPCCNTNYQQGPEKFMQPAPEKIVDRPLVFWYVAQMKNDARPGAEYCWAESFLENGEIVTREYPCYVGPMFTPIKPQNL